jgi:hypothetical protein
MGEIMPDEFIRWWREHRDCSCYEDKEGKMHYQEYPRLAWNVEAYRVEFADCTGFLFKPKNHYSEEEKAGWRRAQAEMEASVKAQEAKYGREYWKRMSPGQFIATVKKEVTAVILAKTMVAKLEEVYAPEPGESEDEVALRTRRRE